MQSVIYNELTNTYKVTNEDGTFDTYTPQQYVETFGALPLVEEDVADVTEAPVDPELLNTIIPKAQLTVEKSKLAFYKVLLPIPFTDEFGNEMGVSEVGSVQQVPKALGDVWVAEGQAELVEVTGPSFSAKLNPFNSN